MLTDRFERRVNGKLALTRHGMETLEKLYWNHHTSRQCIEFVHRTLEFEDISPHVQEYVTDPEMLRKITNAPTMRHVRRYLKSLGLSVYQINRCGPSVSKLGRGCHSS